MNYDLPTAADYAYSAARDASRDANAARRAEKLNAEKIEFLAKRIKVIEATLGIEDPYNEVKPWAPNPALNKTEVPRPA